MAYWEQREAFTSFNWTFQVSLLHPSRFHPPNAPQFKVAGSKQVTLQVTLGAQLVTEEVLKSPLIEVEGILISKPSGRSSSDMIRPR